MTSGCLKQQYSILTGGNVTGYPKSDGRICADGNLYITHRMHYSPTMKYHYTDNQNKQRYVMQKMEVYL